MNFDNSIKEEKQYGFRKYLDTVHTEGIRNYSLRLADGEIEIDDSWSIIISPAASSFIRSVAEDLADYFSTSMEVTVGIKSCDCPVPAKKTILLQTGTARLQVKKSFMINCSADNIIITGFDERGTAQGAYYLEDILSLREAPYFEPCSELLKEPLFAPRMIHSGYGYDLFSPNYMRRVAHAGFDTILLYVLNIEQSIQEKFDLVIDMAEEAGLDIYFYTKMKNPYHPEDNGAREFYDNSYGKLFRMFPKAKGIVFVGESCHFPSRDPNTTMEISSKNYGIPPVKPAPGWWPCDDFPDFMKLIENIIHENSPDADIILWTYNWGYAPENLRLKLIENLPENISLQATFEMFESVCAGGAGERVLDYSVSVPGPGKYFSSEARTASTRGLRLYTMSNTGGLTWDAGSVPYIPAPFQWLQRFEALKECREKYSLSGLMESHHFGWYPSVISECAKWSFWSNSPSQETILQKLACRDFSEENVELVLEAWQEWSRAVSEFVTPLEDQYGPCRIGPSYPFIFTPDILRTIYGKYMQFPFSEKAKCNIVFPWYRPIEDPNGLEIGIRRTKKEIENLPGIIGRWQRGIDLLESTLGSLSGCKLAKADKMLGLGKYMRNTMKTTLNIKRWWLLNSKLMAEEKCECAMRLVDQMVMILNEEIENVYDTIPLVKADSRLGYEPSMDYTTDVWHLEWKLKQVKNILEYDIPAYRTIWNNSL